jgi:hypothetical protein
MISVKYLSGDWMIHQLLGLHTLRRACYHPGKNRQ